MLEHTKAFSGFSVDDIANAKQFYSETLGLRVSEEHGMLTLHIAGDRDTLVYPKHDHAGIVRDPQLPGRGHQRRGGRTHGARRAIRALRGSRRQRDLPRWRAAHRVVQGPSRQRPVRTPRELSLITQRRHPRRAVPRPNSAATATTAASRACSRSSGHAGPVIAWWNRSSGQVSLKAPTTTRSGCCELPSAGPSKYR